MKPSRFIRRFIVVAAVATLFAGCAGQQVKSERFFWPPLPDRPRLEWLNAYHNRLDLPQQGFSKVMGAIVGQDEGLAFKKPLDIASDGNGKVYVTDPGLGGVVVYDFVKSDVHLLAGNDALRMFKQVGALTVDNEGNLYIADMQKKLVMIFDKNENPVRSINIDTHVVQPGGLAVDSGRKRLIVVDGKGHKVVLFSLDGTFIANFGERGARDGEFNFPFPVALTSKGEIVVGDVMNARVQVFDSDGKFLRKFGTRGDGLADFQILKGVAVDSEDNIYVTDGRGHKMMIFSSKGDYLLTIGGQYAAISTGRIAPGGFLIPQGIDIDKNDVIYVVDQLNMRFQVFQYISDSRLNSYPIPGQSPAINK